MANFEAPTADNAVLGYLLAVLSAVSCFGVFIYWLLQPSVVANAGLDPLVSKRTGVLILAPANFDIETSAIALAKQENEKQGIQQAPTAHAESLPAVNAAAAASFAKASAPKPAIKKRVVRVEQQEPWQHDFWSFDRRPNWAYAPNARGYTPGPRARPPFGGGFDNWFR